MMIPLSLGAFLLVGCHSALAFAPPPVIRTPKTEAHFKEYRRNKVPNNFDVVKNGGWYALEQKSTEELAKSNFEKLRPNLPSDLDIDGMGGWQTLEALSADPKGELTNVIRTALRKSNYKYTNYNSINDTTIDALVALLQAEGKGFDSNVVDGEWISVLNRQAKKSPKIQKFVGKGETAGNTYSNFDAKDLSFSGNIKVLFGKGDLQTKVKYDPVPDNYDTHDGKLVLRRISCDIVGASWKFWKLPRVPLPLNKKGGYLDFAFLDKDMRVTRGNRGGLFVHFRPNYLNQIMA